MLRYASTLGASFAALAALAYGASAGTGEAAIPPAAAAAVYERLFSDNASALQDDAAAFCVGIGGGTDLADPGPDVFAALSGNAKVKPSSSCNAEGPGVVLGQDGRPALLFGIEPVECASSTQCTVRAGYYEGNLSSQTNLYTVRNADGAWTASLLELGPISSTAAPETDGAAR